jgi:hypothetical protein
VTTRHLPLFVLGAARLPLNSRDWASSLRLGKAAFLHKSVPEGWWEEYDALAHGKFRPMLFLAASSMAMHSWTEVRRMFQPIGWWLSGRARSFPDIVTRPMRITIGAAAGYAALRMELLADRDPNEPSWAARPPDSPRTYLVEQQKRLLLGQFVLDYLATLCIDRVRNHAYRYGRHRPRVPPTVRKRVA